MPTHLPLSNFHIVFNGDISHATKSTCMGKEQSILLAIGKEVVVVQASILFLLAVKTHFFIKPFSLMTRQVGLLSFLE